MGNEVNGSNGVAPLKICISGAGTVRLE